MNTQTAARLDDSLYRRVCEFYYDEADLLATRQLSQWFALLAQDIHYRVGFPEFYEHGARRQVGIGNPYFDDDYTSLKVRVRLLSDQALTTAEHPPSVYNYFVSNIRARGTDKVDELDVDTRLLIYRVRASEPVPFILGARRLDRLRVIDGGFRIARRQASIDQAIIQSPNMSFLI